MKNIVIRVVIVLVMATIVWLVFRTPNSSAPPGAWGELIDGSPVTSATQLPNPDFETDSLVVWATQRTVRQGPTDISQGGIEKRAGRSGGALRLGPAKAKSGSAASNVTIPIGHADFYFDGYLRVEAKSGKVRATIEIEFQDGSGTPIATYIGWAGAGGAVAPATEPTTFVEELLPATDPPGWFRLPTRTSYGLWKKGLALPKVPTFVEFRVGIDVEDGEGTAWFDDLDLRDMKAGR